MVELILGGQRSGKSARAESLSAQWLCSSPANQGVFIATALAHDKAMATRIDRHQADRLVHLPSMKTVEEPLLIAPIIAANNTAETFIVIDCLTLWLTNWLMPSNKLLERMNQSRTKKPTIGFTYQEQLDALLKVLASSQCSVAIVSNEIGLGVIPMGADVRNYVDELGRLNQQIASICQRVTLMVAGIAVPVKG